MRDRFSRSTLLLILTLITTVFLPDGVTQTLRIGAQSLVPLLQRNPKDIAEKTTPLEEMLRVQNTILQQEVEQLNINVFARATASELAPESIESTLSFALPARVIQRSPEFWYSTFWINVGTQTNQKLGTTIVEKGSPVVLGLSVIGMIDYVGPQKSRVKLITDKNLTPSVRVARGLEQNIDLEYNVLSVIGHLKKRSDVFPSQEENALLIESLRVLHHNLSVNEASWKLAKGVLQGSSHPIWRNTGETLKGFGFNYDFADSQGPAHGLRGENSLQSPVIPLIEKGDLLITTGMDGVFPAGLHVATVSHVFPLQEGDYAYEIEAKPTAGNLSQLSTVTVLPAMLAHHRL